MAGSSNENRVYHGDFSGQIRVEQVEHDGRTTVDIISPKVERTTTPTSSSSITESEKITVKTETSSEGERAEPDVVKIKKERIKVDDESLKRMPSYESFSPLLHVEDYIKFLERSERFMRAFGDACKIDVHGGILSEQTASRLVRILVTNTEENKIDVPILNIFQPLHHYFLASNLLFELKNGNHGNTSIFRIMYERRFEDDWFVMKQFKSDAKTVEELIASFNETYTFNVMQVINRMIMAKKIKTHTVSGRYIMRCVFFVVKMMIFPNIDEPETCMYLHENVKDKEMELRFLGRNVWLRKAWSLFYSVVKSG
jgi:hypothetical protein